jgi:hypothetical protein
VAALESADDLPLLSLDDDHYLRRPSGRAAASASSKPTSVRRKGVDAVFGSERFSASSTTKMWGRNTESVLERLTKLAPEQSGIGYGAAPS